MLDQNIKPADQPRPSTSYHDSDTDNATGGNLPEENVTVRRSATRSVTVRKSASRGRGRGSGSGRGVRGRSSTRSRGRGRDVTTCSEGEWLNGRDF